MRDYRANLHRRAVGRAINRWRTARGMSARQLSEAVGWSQATTSTLQASACPITEAHLSALMMALEVEPEERERARCSVLRAQGLEPLDRGPGLTWRRAELESEAVELRILVSDVVPPLLRTEAYDEAVNAAQVVAFAGYSADEREATLKHLTAAVPLSVHVVLGEGAVRRLIGGERVMAEQLLWLVQLTELPNVTVQVLPQVSGAYAGMGLDFACMSFVERQFGNVVWVPRLTSPASTEAVDEVAFYEQTFAAAAKVALAEDASITFLLDGRASGRHQHRRRPPYRQLRR